jgi:hypothetical protein
MAESVGLNRPAAAGVHVDLDSDANNASGAAMTRAQGPEERDLERMKQILHSMGVHNYGETEFLQESLEMLRQESVIH